MFFVYVLYSSSTDRIYVGMTANLDRRLHEHNAGQTKSTKAYLPWIKIHSESFSTRIEARKREKYLKSYRGRELIRKQFVPLPKDA